MNDSNCTPVIMITGAARRVGAAIARTLHEAGADVILHFRSSAGDADALASELDRIRPGSVSMVQGDLCQADIPVRLIDAAVARHGRLSGLVNNASSFFPTPVGTITPDAWDDLMGTNLKGPLFLSQAATPHLRAARGAIVNIIDIHAERPLRNYPVYCAAKAGLLGLTRALALELAPEVRVNGVSPGPIEWPDDDQFSAQERAEIIDHTLLKRVGSPTDIARTVRFLLFDAPYISGQIIAVDGGRSAHL